MNSGMPITSMRTTRMKLMQWRRRIVPDELGLGWTPFYMLGYLVFLFIPAIFDFSGGSERMWRGMPGIHLGATLATIVIFLPLYFAGFRMTAMRHRIACMLGVAVLGYALLPLNPFSHTYLIYAISSAAFIGGRLAHKVSWMVLLLLAFLLEIVLIGFPVFIFAITAIVSVAVFFSNHYYSENARKGAQLKLSHDEVRRLAALAERERIGRDLHDLLGHTLSLIALKSELAGKLVERDAAAARREIDEVTRVARDALSQVRRAVTGIRAAGLAAELASARLLLESSGVTFRYTLEELGLSPETETVLALGVREAVTNIQRHAHATRAEVGVERVAGHAVLRIVDDGRGSAIVPGNGLSGMRERIEALGGMLRVDSTPGRGTRVEIELPLPEPAPVERKNLSGAAGVP